MFSEFGRRREGNIRKVNLLGVNDKTTHLHTLWYLVKINHSWYGVNNSQQVFTNKFKSKKELFNYFKSTYSEENITTYLMDTDYYMISDKNLFNFEVDNIIYNFEKHTKGKVEKLSDGINVKRVLN